MTKQERVARARKAGLASGVSRWRNLVKEGDIVCVNGKQNAVVACINRDRQVKLDRTIDGYYWWHINDLTPPKFTRHRKSNVF